MPAISTAYANFKKYSVQYNLINNTFSCSYAKTGEIITDAQITGVFYRDQMIFTLADYRHSSFQLLQEMDSANLIIRYGEGPVEQPSLSIVFRLDIKGIHVKLTCRGDLDFHFAGKIHWGQDCEHDTFAISLNRDGQDLRSALGPAASTVDRALFDRKNGAALEFFYGLPVRLSFDWGERIYRFTLNTEGNDYVRGFAIRVLPDVYQRQFGVRYQPINKNNTFPTPPAGWMTWYAVQFDASEKVVLENAAWQAEHLGDFGAKALWVDWEWYHRDFSGIGEPDVDTFHPDPRRYPHGLKYVAEKITELGLTPALWVGFTNDPTENELIKKDADIVLTQKPSWCGQYFLDVTHPKYLQEYIPAAFGQLRDWGYKALKWDCMPTTLEYLDHYHDSLTHSEITSEEALRGAIKAAREFLGPHFYMLYCAGTTCRDITMAADLFDAARIGGDIFKWEEYVSQCIARVMKFYAYHNIMFYNDPDNVVLRAQFNSFEQAVSRLSFNALLGLPLTIGDRLTDLPDERVELLRRGLPPVDAHPMDIRETVHDLKVVKLNLAIEKPFDSWNVVDVMNLQSEDADVQLDLSSDMHLSPGVYLIYDFWEKKYLGEYEHTLPLRLRPYASKVLAVRRKLDRPQLLSTSRHLTQGAVDLVALDWEARSSVLSGVSKVIKGDPYKVVLYAPDGMKPDPGNNRTSIPQFDHPGEHIYEFEIVPEQTGDLVWSIAFCT